MNITTEQLPWILVVGYRLYGPRKPHNLDPYGNHIITQHCQLRKERKLSLEKLQPLLSFFFFWTNQPKTA